MSKIFVVVVVFFLNYFKILNWMLSNKNIQLANVKNVVKKERKKITEEKAIMKRKFYYNCN